MTRYLCSHLVQCSVICAQHYDFTFTILKIIMKTRECKTVQYRLRGRPPGGCGPPGEGWGGPGAGEPQTPRGSQAGGPSGAREIPGEGRKYQCEE